MKGGQLIGYVPMRAVIKADQYEATVRKQALRPKARKKTTCVDVDGNSKACKDSANGTTDPELNGFHEHIFMNNKNFHRMWFPFFALIFALIGGCTSSSHSDPPYNLQFQAHPQINDSAPLKVKGIAAKSDADFMSSDFYLLQNNASATLWRESQTAIFLPDAGQFSKTLGGQSSPESALYRRDGGIPGRWTAKWRVSLPLPVPGENAIYQF